MRVVVATAAGVGAAYLPTPEAGVQLLLELAEHSATEIARYKLPSVYRVARYQRETRSPERWQSAAVTAWRRKGDCEDLAVYRVAGLWQSGIDSYARPALVQRGPGMWHAVVVRGDGMVEDPSAVLGMTRRGLELALREVPGGWQARLIVPCGPGSSARAYGSGQLPLDAVCEAATELAAGLEANRIPTAPDESAAEVVGVPQLPLAAARELELVIAVVESYARGRLAEAAARISGGRASPSLSAALRRCAALSGC